MGDLRSCAGVLRRTAEVLTRILALGHEVRFCVVAAEGGYHIRSSICVKALGAQVLS